ncbi:sulfur-containing amino acid ABC transporter substrate-binding protein TcyJ [Bacillus inaquosorum]|uniref:sulfur-containing amino acid ABC transporter substrate-binding protein TcyJ n=1 Tax=Bacillus inaquosorum TaxID=483913 RepID=UPI001060D53A|nr:sulfur-containing amino acid ABC transporter substrate-binding protein TcyJ [Bacillus inaquosorum]TDO12844.1 L-cystine-binding protein /L-cystathionine-binding protein [Bacillus subtilis]MCY7748601.1 sulfur-containing amino acid ABC transporter substrate-binding protein TcyJ [Bacillus inaquosorum]MCY7788303.1 sulfur-containing amino acid ABC transporter substrate-binding protein TcyJ [Bacillus inaquosorum]MCY7820858.1 sulfur-containing amino acid ABC transporter substrate-binding protein Tcy
MNKRMGMVLLLSVVALLGGCGSETNNKTDRQVQTVIVGTGTDFPNIAFLNEKGDLTGYDIEVMKAIDKELPQYTFEFKTMDFSNLLTSLGNKKIDVIAHNMAKNKEREKRFLYHKVPYNYSPMYITVREDNNKIHTLKDLHGKTVIVGATSNAADYITKYNKTHGSPIHLKYAGQGSNDTANQIETGRADATISTPFAVDFQNKTHAFRQKTVGDVLLDTEVYFMFNKGSQTLADATDQAIKKLEKNGTLKKLSRKWLGADYSKSSFEK